MIGVAPPLPVEYRLTRCRDGGFTVEIKGPFQSDREVHFAGSLDDCLNYMRRRAAPHRGTSEK